VTRLHVLLAAGVAAIAPVAGIAVPAAHADGTTIVASSGDRDLSSYTTPLAVTPVGGPVTFLNGDLQPHGLSSDLIGPDTNPWCANRFDTGACPLFWAPTTDAGFRESTVLGLDQLASGQTYGFHCPLHPNMKGTLVAL